ncbi:MAG: AMP-binding protein, partial [Chloroflexi bacterium]|nr:AMP-binding protein [Chloroflexota bacterium]
PAVGPDDLCEIAFTSGTTGVPKGVMLTHGNFLAEIEALRVAFPLKRSFRALSVLPLSHAFELVVNLLLTFTSGVCVTYVARVNAVTMSRALRESRITCLALVPELLRLLLSGMERRAQREGKWRQWQLAHRLAGPLPIVLRPSSASAARRSTSSWPRPGSAWASACSRATASPRRRPRRRSITGGPSAWARSASPSPASRSRSPPMARS